MPVALFPHVTTDREGRRYSETQWHRDVVDRLAGAGPEVLESECAGRAHLDGRLSNRQWDVEGCLGAQSVLAPTFAQAAHLNRTTGTDRAL